MTNLKLLIKVLLDPRVSVETDSRWAGHFGPFGIKEFGFCRVRYDKQNKAIYLVDYSGGRVVVV